MFMFKFRSQFSILFWVFLALVSSSCAHSKKSTSDQNSRSGTSSKELQIRSPLSSEKKILQELTGKPSSTLPTQAELKNKPLSTQHYYAGLRAAETKNYIMAIKHFNTVLKNYPQSKEVKLSFSAKAKVYNEMGLTEPANLNMRLARSQKNPLLRKTASASATVDQVKGNQKTKK